MLWNNVETKPYGFYPLAWDVEAARHARAAGVERSGAYDGPHDLRGGRRPASACSAGARRSSTTPIPNVGEDDCAGTVEQGAASAAAAHDTGSSTWRASATTARYPACLASCPRGSIYKRPEDGIVLVDQGRCRGYQECVKACPYKKVFFNPMTGTSEKCIACFPKIEMGMQPQCFVNCIGKIRFAGWISTPEKAREDNPIDYLVHVRKRLRRSLSTSARWVSARPSSHGMPGVLDRRERAGARCRRWPRDVHDVGQRLDHAGGDGADAVLGHQLHRHLGRVDLLEVVDELGEVLDRVDVVVRRRRDEPDAGLGVAQPGDLARHLVARQLAALARLRALGHLDLDLVGEGEVLRGHAEAARGDLLDLASSCRRARGRGCGTAPGPRRPRRSSTARR